MGGAGCRHAVRDRVAVRLCGLYDWRIAVSFAVRAAENRGTRAADLTSAHDAKKDTYEVRTATHGSSYFQAPSTRRRDYCCAGISRRMTKVCITKFEISTCTWRSSMSAASQDAFVVIPKKISARHFLPHEKRVPRSAGPVFHKRCISNYRVFCVRYNLRPSRRKLLSLHFLRCYASSGSSCDYDWFF